MAGGLDGLLNMSSGENKAPKNVKAVTTDQDFQVYKWRDENGVMHFGEARPTQTSGVEQINLKSNHNVMKATSAPKATESSTEIKQVDVSNPYSPEGMSQMIEQTKALTESLNQQTAEKEKMLQGISQH